MTLSELIDELKEYNPRMIIKNGFNNPHSYRGDYNELSFEPASYVTVNDMLRCAIDVSDSTFGGWKGGDYIMRLDTTVHLAYEGTIGDVEFNIELLKSMLED